MATAEKREPSTKVCSKCCEAKPVSHFRRQGAGRSDRRAECRACNRAYQRDRARKKRKKKLTQGMTYMATCRAADRALRIADEMILAFGGLPSFCALLKAAYDQAAEQGKAFTCMKIQQGITRLLLASEELNTQAREILPSLSDAEKDEALREIIASCLERAPQVFKKAMQCV